MYSNHFKFSFSFRDYYSFLISVRILSVIIALLVQLVERRFPKPDVEGSSPSGRVLALVFLKNRSKRIIKVVYRRGG